MTWLLAHSLSLNFWISGAQLLLGVAIGFVGKPALVRKGSFGEWAFGLWTSQWLFFLLIYLVLLRYPSHEILLLAFVDTQSIVVLASAAILLLGEPLKLRRTLIILGLLWFVCVICNLMIHPSTDHLSPSEFLRWTLLSQTLSVLSLVFIGVVACLRYRLYGFPLLLAAIAYSACQQALYSVTLLRVTEMSPMLPDASLWYLLAAICKALLGGSFYALSFLVLSSYPRLFSSDIPDVPDAIKARSRVAVASVIGFFTGPFAAAVIVDWLYRLVVR